MTDLVSQTFDGFAAWHPDFGFDAQTFREFEIDTVVNLGSGKQLLHWRVVPVTITITATGTGETG